MCPSLKDPKDGSVIANGFTIGNIADYLCNGGFKMNGTANRTCMMNSEWDGEPPNCDSTFGNELSYCLI